MQKKIHLLLLLCMAFFMVCATVEMSARTVVPHSVLTEQDGTHQGDESFFMPESPFFFFAPDYITPLSSSPGTVPGIPGVKCVDLYVFLHHILHSGRFDVGLPVREDASCPSILTDKDYYVLVLRHIVV